MALTLTPTNTLLGTLAPKSGAARMATTIGTIVLGSLLLAVSAKISVPVMPVPVSLATFAVAFLAAAFGARIAVATVALYIAEGLAGLPVFTYGGGLGYVASPSFGFILGFLPMAFIIGKAADLGVSGKVMRLFGAMLVADAVLFAFGFAWLMLVASMMTQSGAALPAWLDAGNLVGTAFAGAVQPFVIWDVLKMALAALSVVGLWQLVPKKG